MVAETITPVALRILRAEDLELLLSLGWRRSYERGETLLAAGERIEQVTLVEQGTLEVVDVADGRETTVRVIGAGEAIGIEALGEARAAEQAIRAATDTIAIVFRPREWEKLLESHPQVAARVAWALAAAGATERRPAAPAEPTVGAAPRAEVPASVARAIGELETALQAIAADREVAARPEAAVERVAPLLDAIVHTTFQATEGLSDEAARALVAAVRRQLLPWLQRSRLVRRMLERRPSEPARFRSLDHIYRARPAGDDAVGLVIDTYLLTRPFAEAIRERRAYIAHELNREVGERAAPDRVVRVLTLGSGPARALADLLQQRGNSELVAITCVDDDREALVHANNLLKSIAPRAEIVFREGSPADLDPSASGYGGYDVIATLFTPDALDLPRLERLIGLAHSWLRVDGVLLFTARNAEGAAGRTMDLFLNWRPTRYTPSELQQALADSPFRGGEVRALPSGINLWVRATKTG